MMLGEISGLIYETVQVYLQYLNGYNFFFPAPLKIVSCIVSLMKASLPRLKKIGNPTVPHLEGVPHF